MATSARTASLLAQRAAYSPYGSSGRIKLLQPANTSIASIAKKTATSELDVMVKNYNAGQVGNSDMLAFLQKMQNNPGLTDTDRADVGNQIKDFNFRIQGDQLQAQYKAAPDSSLQQLTAARNLATYYKSRASSYAVDSPPYSDAITNASAYENRVLDITKTINTQNRTNLRYQEEEKVNALPDGTSEQATQKAAMYKKLYDAAVADGATNDASRYAAYYQNAITSANTLSTNEEVSGEKTDLRNTLGALQNAYHDGQINEKQYLDALAEISPRIDATNDYGLINTLNRTTDIIQKNLEKGGLRRTTTSSGLPVVLGKGKGTGAGVVTDWDQKDYNYSDNLRTLKTAFDKKQINAKQYMDGVRIVVLKRADDITAQIESLEATADANPNTKVLFNGRKTRVADALESLYTEQGKLEKSAGAVIQSDPKKLVLVMVAPKNDNGFSTYEVHSLDTLKNEGKYIKDSSGFYHEVLKKEVQLTDPGAVQLAMQSGGYYTDEAGNSYKLRIDKNGRAWYSGGEQFVKVYEPHSSKSYDLTVSGDKVQSFSDRAKQLDLEARQATSPAYLKQQAAIKKKSELDAITATKQASQNGIVPQIAKAGGAVINNVLKPQGINPLDAAKAVGNVVGPIAEKVGEVIAPIIPKPPIEFDAASSESLGITPNTRINSGGSSPIALPQSVGSGNRVSIAPQPLRLAGTPPTPAITKALKGTAPIKIAAPPKPSYTPPKNADYSIAGSAKALVSNVKKLFGFK